MESVRGSDGEPRVSLRLPSWEEYVAVALDEIIAIAGASLQVRGRIERMLTELLAIAPEARAESLRARMW